MELSLNPSFEVQIMLGVLLSILCGLVAAWYGWGYGLANFSGEWEIVVALLFALVIGSVTMSIASLVIMAIIMKQWSN